MRSRLFVPLAASALLLGALATAGCSKVTKETAPEGVLHPSIASEATFTATVIFPTELVAGSESQRTATLGGRDTDDPALSAPVVATYDPSTGVFSLVNVAGFQFPGNSESTIGYTLFQVTTPLSPGVVTLGSTNNGTARRGIATWSYQNSGTHAWHTTDAVGGTLTIHSYDWVHHLLWATYAFDAVDGDGYVLKVTGSVVARVGEYTPPATGAAPVAEGAAR